MKKFVLCAVAALTAGAVLAESEFNRTYFTRENRRPDAGALEAGVFSEYSKIDESGNNKWADRERKEFTAGVYARYGLLENLTAYGKLPFGHIDSDINDKHTGIRDISLGLELYAYELPPPVSMAALVLRCENKVQLKGSSVNSRVFFCRSGLTSSSRLTSFAPIVARFPTGSGGRTFAPVDKRFLVKEQ